MVQFIELTHENGKKFRLAIDKIIGFDDFLKAGCRSEVFTVEGDYRIFKETPAEVMEKIDKVQRETLDKTMKHISEVVVNAMGQVKKEMGLHSND